MPNPNPIALVADLVDTHDTSDITNRKLEHVEARYFSQVTTTLEDLGREVVHIDHPSGLIDRASELIDHTVLPLWSGENSRSRRALCASICESKGMTYLGADPYTAIICQDKSLSKDYSRRFGILSAPSILIDPGASVPAGEPFDGPYVVKPVFEGGSIGIDQNSKCETWDQVKAQVTRLSAALGSTIMVEGFLEGDEVSICMMGKSAGEARFAALQLYLEGFDITRNVWSMEVKKSSAYKHRNIDVTQAMDEEIGDACRALFDSFEKLDCIRIDGRMTTDGFRLLEQTPDVHLGSGSNFAQSMGMQGVVYKDMWTELLAIVE